MNIQFIYDEAESSYLSSKYTTCIESYYVYDFKNSKAVKDVNGCKTFVTIDREYKLILFTNMKTKKYGILKKNYFYKIIQEFMKQTKDFNCEDYIVYEDTSGGHIYYKYN